MTEPLQVGQFGIVDHEPVDRGPNAGFFQGKGPTDDRAELFVVAEGTTPAGEAFAGHVVSAVGQAWTELDMSVTGALLRAFHEAARNLDDWNRKSIAQHRVSLGMTCFAHRGDQAVLAQAGPTVAFHLHEGRLVAYTPSGDSRSAIGAGNPVEPELARLSFGPSDRLLLLSTAAAAELDHELIAGILALPGEQALQDLYHRLHHLRHATVLLVTGGVGLRRPEDDASIPTFEGSEEDEVVIDATTEDDQPGDGYQPSLFIRDEHEGEVEAARRKLLDISARVTPRPALPRSEPAAVAPLRRVSGESILGDMAAERRAVAAASRQAVTASMAAAAAGRRPSWRAAASSSRDDASSFDRRRSSSFTRSLTPGSRPILPELSGSDAPFASDLAEGRRNRTREGVQPAASGLEGASALAAGGATLVRPRTNMGGRWKGGGSLSGRSALGRQQLPPTWLVIVVGLGVLMALVGSLTLPGLLSGDEAGDAAALVDQAQQELATARVQEDPAARRIALTRAQVLLLEARDVGGATAADQGLVNEVAGAIADLDAIHQPSSVETIADLSQFGQHPVTPSHIVAGGGTVYLLDTASAQVIAVAQSGGEPVAVYAEAADGGKARPVAIAYVNSPELGATGALVIVDANRGLWTLAAAGTPKPTLFNIPAKASVTDIASYGGDLYVLDASGSRVFRFSPSAGEFGREPEIILESPELARSARMTFDGEVVTADGDGTLHRFSGQLWLELSQAGIDHPLASAQAPQSFADGNEIAVLEPEGDRIIVLLRDGTFARQYQDPAFAAISAFGMGDGEGYVFSGGQLRRVNW